MFVKITATDQVIEQFCYLPLKSGEVYEAKHSRQSDKNTLYKIMVEK